MPATRLPGRPKPQDARIEKALNEAIDVGFGALEGLLGDALDATEEPAKKALAKAVLHGMEAMGIDTATVNVVTSGKVNIRIR